MAKAKCKKCGTLLKVVYMQGKHAMCACPRCNPTAFRDFHIQQLEKKIMRLQKLKAKKRSKKFK